MGDSTDDGSETVKLGSLFSGIGGLEMGLCDELGLDLAWQTEIDRDASTVLAARFDAPNLGDLTAVDWSEVEPVDWLCGGFPCQDISAMGTRAGVAAGSKSGLWREYVRAIRALGPRVVVVENVPALTRRGLGIVLGDLAVLGFDAWWSVFSSAAVGAPHRRERLFVVAADADASHRRDDHERHPSGEMGPPVRRPVQSSRRFDRFAPWHEAVARWASLRGDPPDPFTTGGGSNPEFAEWMMGFPIGWTEGPSRTARFRLVGNAVQPQVATRVGRWAAGLMMGARR